jgi:hypothetical protein
VRYRGNFERREVHSFRFRCFLGRNLARVRVFSHTW